MERLRMGILVTVVGVLLTGCTGGPTEQIEVDGSSTVFPITEAVAESFRTERADVQVNVGVSGTGGGFKRFVAGELDLADASRPIKESEAEQAAAAGIEFTELRVAIDGIALVANPTNSFLACLTTAELKRLWEPSSTVTTWRDLRPEWPAEPITLFGPGTDSGTFDYFTEAIVGKEDASRPDYTASEDDNVLVQGVAGDTQALGYFGYAYYAQNTERLKLISIDSGSGCVQPSPETLQAGTYSPLARPLLLYVKRGALARPVVADFVRFYLDQAPTLVPEVGYVAFSTDAYAEQRAILERAVAELEEHSVPQE